VIEIINTLIVTFAAFLVAVWAVITIAIIGVVIFATFDIEFIDEREEK